MRFIPLTLLALYLASLGACSEPESNTGAQEQEKKKEAVVVTVASALTQDVEVVEETVGQLDIIYSPSLSAEIDARVLAVHFDVGESVQEGALLIELDAKPLRLEREALRAEGASLAAELLQQKRTVRRFENLIGKKHISEDELDAARSKANILQARHEEVLARIRVLNDRIERAAIHAPIAASINYRHVDQGDYVKKGDPLIDLVDTQRLRAMMPFPETVASKIQVGNPVQLRSNFSPDPIQVFVSDIRPTLIGNTRSLLVMADFDNPGGWRADSSVRAQITIDKRSQSTVVDALAVVRRPQGEVVYVAENQQARERAVKTGARLEGFIEIVEGLAPGAQIIVQGAAYLNDGSPITVRAVEP